MSSDDPADDYRRLARTDPDRALWLLTVPPLRSGVLTFVAEGAGDELPGHLVVQPLLNLAAHPDRLVREGVVYGLARHMDRPDVIVTMSMLAEDAESRGVRTAALGVIEASR